ncbi:MAG: hypothetical protein JSS27_15545 [Planctomycetes bacterium]|nr:hypothetical protein [Planctomycetota bacterium]
MQAATSDSISLAAASQHSLVKRKLRAPQADRSVLVEPAWETLPGLLARNVAARRIDTRLILDRPLVELAAQARGELLTAATRYTSAYRAAPAFSPEQPLVAAGHQPQLFHPGVWLKNFSLDALARRAGAAALNLVVDGDTIKSSLVPIATGTPEHPHRGAMPLDADGPELPWEERAVLDEALWTSVDRRASDLLKGLLAQPLIGTLWPRVVERARATDRAGLAMAQARHALEADWGLATLELPQSALCETESFAWFAAWVLDGLPRFRDIYNGAIDEYRQVYHLRSANHPAPKLAADGPALEAPFWLWTGASPRRRAAFVTRQAGELILTDRQTIRVALPAPGTGRAAATVAAITALKSQGIRLRSRALTTTLFCRLVASDLFLHGIGGGKYDEVTQLLAARFAAAPLPADGVVSGTLHLPVAKENVAIDQMRRLEHQLRSLEFQPERFLAGADGQVRELIERKRAWIDDPFEPSNAKRRAREISQLNDELQPAVAERRRELLAERTRLRAALARRQVLSWREYPFAWYPEPTLRGFLVEGMPRAGQV